MTGYWRIYYRGLHGECTRLISANPKPQSESPAKVSHKRIAPSVGAERTTVEKLLIRWSPEYHSTLPDCACFDGQWWKHRWMREKLPFVGCCWFLFCGFLLAQEWRFAVWLLGTVGQCSQSSVCSLACRAPRVSLAPEGRQTKRHHCLSHWSCSPTHSSFLLNGGTFLFRGEEWQKKQVFFLEIGPQDNKTTVVLSYVFFSV